jgi:DeoR family fructose operon transcriptional repressor
MCTFREDVLCLSDIESIFAEERKDRILAMLERKQKVTVSELSKAFGVSEVTIRKDLNSLESMGLLKS